jgi:phage shock protein PspC (stress-responsive transcriptional regulator)
MARPGLPSDHAAMDTTLDPPPASTLDPPPAPPPDPDPPPPPRPALARNTSARVLGGVAAGIADHFGVDPILVRLGFVVATFFGGIGVLAYVVAWILLPDATPGAPPAPRDNRQLLAFGLVALGLATIPGGLGFGWHLGGGFWPIALIVFGSTVLWLRTRDDQSGASAPPPAGPPASAPAASFVAPPNPPPSAAPVETAATPSPARPHRPQRVKEPRGPVSAITLSALLILGGVAWLVAATGRSSVDLGVVAAIALTIVGAGLVVSAWIGRARGLVVLGILLALVVGAFGAIDVPIRGGVGETTYTPATHAGIHDHYRMAIGRLELDFTREALVDHRTEVHATVGIGRLVVRVPHDVRLVVHGHAGVGDVSILGRDGGNCCPSDAHVVRAGTPGRGTLVLHARVGAGAVDVTRVPTVPRAPTPPGVPSIPNAPSREVRDAPA